eukprot:13976227-Ditylum_brightwellii.AAC.1
MSMEGLAMEYVDASNVLTAQRSVKGEWHSFLSANSDKGAATTATHTENFLKVLFDSNRIERGKVQ